jgi:hypothetical protein
LEELLSFIAYVFVEVVLISSGRFAVWLFSAGRWRGERIAQNEAKIYGPAGALSFRRDGQRVVTRTGLLFAGVLFCIGLAVALLFWGSQVVPT